MLSRLVTGTNMAIFPSRIMRRICASLKLMVNLYCSLLLRWRNSVKTG